ncbi:MAG: V-type ATP synthase subunit I [Chlamydiales bacterium]
MRYDVKKYLFVGTLDQRDLFFKQMQKAGIVHFIDMKLKKGHTHSPELETIGNAIKVVLSLPTRFQQDFDHYENAPKLANKILALKHEIDSLMEEKRVTHLEIERIEPFGNFNINEIKEIERKGKRRIQFFCTKQDQPLPDEPNVHMIYIASDHGLDYYIGIHSNARQFEHYTQMHFEFSLDELKARLQEIEERLEELEENLKVQAQYNDYLHRSYIYFLNDYELQRHEGFPQEELNGNIFAVEGWIPHHKIDEIEDIVKNLRVYYEQIAQNEEETPPTYLENHGVAAVGEDLINIYDTPSYEDKDPSMWVLGAFAFFFAMIVGDAGYGFIFLAIALYLNYRFSQAKGAGKRFIKLSFILAGSCIVWGIMTHSFFGINLDIDSPLRKVSLLQWLVEKKAAYHIKYQDATYQEWIQQNPAGSEVQSAQQFLRIVKNEDEGGAISFPILEGFTKSVMLELALLVGIIHIALSFARYLGRNWSGLGWILALLGGYLYFPEYLEATSMSHYVLGIPPEIGESEGILLIAGGFGLTMILAIIQNRLMGLTEIANIIQVFADVLSYLRLYALALAGGIMSQTINEMSGSLPIVLGIVLIVIGHIVNIALSIMGGVIHGLRLNFIEWYHYSFEGGGKLFKPLKLLKID